MEDDKEREQIEELRKALGLPEGELGNMFGWKISFIGLAVILFVLGLITFRYWQIGYFSDDYEPVKTEIPIENSQIK